MVDSFDLKSLYTKELEQLSQMSFIRRFSLQNELYEKILENPRGLERMEIFLRPLFSNTPEKIYNLKKATELQKPIRKKEVEELRMFELKQQKKREKHKGH